MTKLNVAISALSFMVSAVFLLSKCNSQMENTITKKVNVWDTYVTKKDGNIMHFDIIAPVDIQDTLIIYQYGKEYLKTKNQHDQPLTSKQCRLCHMEQLRPQWEAKIEENGYFIIEMEGC